MANGAKFPNPINGKYPKWCNSKNDIENGVVLFKALFMLLSEFKTENEYKPMLRALRELTNAINGYFEKKYGFYYGISAGVHEMLTSGTWNDKLIIVEHAVPFVVLIKIVSDEITIGNIKDDKKLEEFLKEHYHICLVTKVEDEKLSRKNMPTGWTVLNDWQARYEKSGIKLISFPGKI